MTRITRLAGALLWPSIVVAVGAALISAAVRFSRTAAAPTTTATMPPPTAA